MADDTPAPADLSKGAPVVTNRLRNPWKPIAIALALLLAAVLIATALVTADVMKLGFSLL
jgi:hypothetical protein